MTNANIEVFDCTDFVSFSNLLSSYEARQGNTFPSIDGVAVTTWSTKCALGTYSTTSSLSTVTVSNVGAVSVSTTSAISSVSIQVIVEVGTQK